MNFFVFVLALKAGAKAHRYLLSKDVSSTCDHQNISYKCFAYQHQVATSIVPVQSETSLPALDLDEK